MGNWFSKSIPFEKIIEKFIEKEVVKEVEKVVEKIVDVSKVEFERSQNILEPIMNKGFEKIMGSANENGASTNNTPKVVVMNIGPSGSGKSTTCNILFGTDFETKSSCLDVTTQLSPPTTSPKYKDYSIIDTVGFTPNITNISKVILLLFHHGFFPDFLLYPAQNDRIVEIISLVRLVHIGVLKIMIAPFSSKSYYDGIKLLQTFNKTPIEEAKKMSIDTSFNKELNEKIKVVLQTVSITGSAVPIESMDKIPVINGSMKYGFLNLFFKDNKFIKMKYEEYKENLANKDEKVSTKALLYGCLIEAAKGLQIHANLNNQGLIQSINECEYLKD